MPTQCCHRIQKRKAPPRQLGKKRRNFAVGSPLHHSIAQRALAAPHAERIMEQQMMDMMLANAMGQIESAVDDEMERMENLTVRLPDTLCDAFAHTQPCTRSASPAAHRPRRRRRIAGGGGGASPAAHRHQHPASHTPTRTLQPAHSSPHPPVPPLTVHAHTAPVCSSACSPAFLSVEPRGPCACVCLSPQRSPQLSPDFLSSFRHTRRRMTSPRSASSDSSK